MIFSILVALNSITAVTAAPIKSNPISGVVTVPLQKTLHSGSKHNATKRSLPDEDLDYTGYRYMANFLIGNQSQYVFMDTGSSDTWVYSNQEWSGGYDPEKSPTWKWLNDDFSASYGDGDNSFSGTWGTDTVSVGGAVVPSYPFAILNASNPYFGGDNGILAFGPKAAETASTEYPTFTERLKEVGTIQSNSFSLFSDASNSEATLLIGGIDTAKFNAPLYTVPFDTTESYGSSFYSIDFEYNGTTYANGVLDTGTPAVMLPQDVADVLASENGYTYDNSSGYYIRYTQPPSSDQPDVELKIGGIPITIPGSQSYYQIADEYFFNYARAVKYPDLELNILGDPILRQLYLFFDIDKNQVAFAPIVQTDASSPVAVSSTIPDSTPAPIQTVG